MKYGIAYIIDIWNSYTGIITKIIAHNNMFKKRIFLNVLSPGKLL